MADLVLPRPTYDTKKWRRTAQPLSDAYSAKQKCTRRSNMPAPSYSGVPEASQRSAQVRSTVRQARVYQHTKTRGGHLHQGDHYGDKIYNVVGKAQEIDVPETAFDVIEACLPLEQFVELVLSLLISSEHCMLLGECLSDNSTPFEALCLVPESLERILNDAKVTGRFRNPDDPKNPIPDCESIIDDLRVAITRVNELHETGERLPQCNLVIRNAFIEVHGEGCIVDLASKLEMVQKMMYESVEEIIRYHVSQATKRLQAIRAKAKKYGTTYHDNLLKLANSIRDYSGLIHNGRTNHEITSACIQLMSSEVDSASSGRSERCSLQQLSGMLKDLEDQTTRIESNLNILNGLYFKMIEARHRSIIEPYESTFTWILQDVAATHPSTPVEFVSWLRMRSGAFLLRGKAGSGKSTMMKYVFDHQQTKKLLKEWAGKKKLVMAKHFFWRTGNKLQRSIVGLLRTLLFEILRAQPDFTVHVWEAMGDMISHTSDEETDWTRKQLEGALTSILRHGGHEMNTKFCFFIDGLDEFEESDEIGENQGQLLLTLKKFCDSEHIKFCVSSRPTNMLLNAFPDDSGYQLQLEDLTRADIEKYVRIELGSHRPFSQHDGSQELATLVVSRAEGVFLWVILVVRSLSNGQINGENFRMLKERLEKFPQDLKHVFGHMIHAVDSERLPETALLFWLATSIDQGELAVIYSAVDDILDYGNVTTFLNIPQNTMSKDDVDEGMIRLRNNLDLRSKGLLEIHSDDYPSDPYSGHTVNYHHRTVRDYLFDNGVSGSMTKKYPLTSFGNTWPLIPCAATLTVIRRLPPNENVELAFWVCWTMLSLAREAERQLDDTEDLSHILETAEIEWRRKWPGYGDHWMRNASEAHVCSYMGRQHPLRLRSLFHCDPAPRQPDHTAPLSYALRMDFAHAQDCSHERFCIQKRAVELLLQHNADPNRWDFYDNTTPWKVFIKTIRMSSKLSHDDEQILPLIKLLLRHGADPDALVCYPENSMTPVRQLLRDIFGAAQTKILLNQPGNRHHLEGRHILIAGLDVSSLSFIITLRKLWVSEPKPPRLTIIYGSETRHIYRRADEDHIQVLGHGAPTDVAWLENSGLPQVIFKSPGHRTGSFKIWNSDWTEMMSCNSSTVTRNGAINRIKMKDLRRALIEAVEMTDEIRWNVTCSAARKLPKGTIEVDIRCAGPENYPLSTTLECDLLIAADGALAFEPPAGQEMATQATMPVSSSMVKSFETFKPSSCTGFVQIGGIANFEQGLPSKVQDDWGLQLLGPGVCCFFSPIDREKIAWTATFRIDMKLKSNRTELSSELKEKLRRDYGPLMREVVDKTGGSKSLNCSEVEHKSAFEHRGNESSIIFLGESNHPLALFAGYGAGLGLSEGTELARCLYSAHSVEAGVSAFDAVVVPRVNATLETSRFWMNAAHSRGLVLASYKVYLFLRGLFQRALRKARSGR